MMRHGFIGTAPLHPTSAISITMLEIYRTLSNRCPSLSIQAFVRGACDLQKVAYKGGMRKAFSQAFDVYLEILHRIDQQLDRVLYSSTLLTKLHSACPACAFKVKDEPAMKFSVLMAMDGNESLKRVHRTQTTIDDVTVSVENPDSRERGSHFFMGADDVNVFKNEVKRRKPAKAKVKDSPCVDRWSNLAAESNKKMCGIFEETGIFISACRHGIVQQLCDMIRSGELAKYPLALLDRLMESFGDNILQGYDIGCGFSTTANNSGLLGPKLRAQRCRLCCNAFHGHAHCRLCQLRWHPLYIKGAGLEDFETCERVFSESNKLAAVTRHASKFHRRQAILRYFARWNIDKYAEIPRFIFGNYKQALENIKIISAELIKAKQALNIHSDEVFVAWHEEELKYLQSLKDAPKLDDLAMQYVSTLQSSSQTCKLEHARRRGLAKVISLQESAEQLEEKLGITQRWSEGSDGWKRASADVATRNYQRAIDRLEGLVVQRLFELGKQHRAQTGYKLRKHIAKAIKVRSRAIRRAIKKYNNAAAEMTPHRPPLEADDVLNYVFLAEFDLLRDSRFEVHKKAWSSPAAREASVAYFKLERSQEEIIRLNVETRRVSTFIRDFEEQLQDCVRMLGETNKLLAHQMVKRQALFVALHRVMRARIADIELLPGFTGTAGPGTVLHSTDSTDAFLPVGNDRRGESDSEDDGDEDGDEEADQATDEVVEIYTIVED
ncbi:hypothetical protein DFH11DRAFT_1515076 [Phellopilus nigrolimitatus]|nr:hypothetical protein DFH11DRAFT_1515076 [Phellopilus nigrolimitatus]